MTKFMWLNNPRDESGKKRGVLFASVISPWIRKFFCRFLQMLSTAASIEVSVVYPQGSLPCWLAAAYNFRKYLPSFFFLIDFYSIGKVGLARKSGTINHFTIIEFTWFRLFKLHEIFWYLQIVNTNIFLYFQKVFTLKLWQKTQFMTAILFLTIIPRARMENDSEAMRAKGTIVLVKSN